MMRNRLILFIFLVLFPSGCFLAPAIDSFNQLGLTKGDRQQLLGGEVKKFQDALYWGNPTEAVTYTAEENRATLAEEIRKSKHEERIVESRIESVDFSKDAFKAEVEVLVKYYKVPSYIVNERVEKQEWKFSVPDGWKIASRTPANQGS